MKFLDDWKEKYFQKQLSKLPPELRPMAVKLNNILTSFINNFVKPVSIAIGLFYIFNRIKLRVGYPDAFYILGVVIIIWLRSINDNLRKLFG